MRGSLNDLEEYVYADWEHDEVFVEVIHENPHLRGAWSPWSARRRLFSGSQLR